MRRTLVSRASRVKVPHIDADRAPMIGVDAIVVPGFVASEPSA